jgi:hypothetical protein
MEAKDEGATRRLRSISTHPRPGAPSKYSPSRDPHQTGRRRVRTTTWAPNTLHEKCHIRQPETEISLPSISMGEKLLSTGVRETARRPLRIFPFDPMSDRFEGPIVSKVPYEVVEIGPKGRLVEVVDFDLSTQQWLTPLDLNTPEVLIGQGVTPSERDLRSHQQMVYAVSMRVLEAFERGLGRPFVWLEPLTLLPHAVRMDNARFMQGTFALYFGYFPDKTGSPAGGNLAGQPIFTALSYDVVAHEMCHPAMLGFRPLDSDEDIEAMSFHEGMADLIALLVRCTEPDVIARIIRTHGACLSGTPLLKMAMQFGTAIAAEHGSIRKYPLDEGVVYDPTSSEPHARGALLASAFLEAFLATYDQRTRDLLRLNGSPPVQNYVHPDLVRRLASEATALATDVTRSIIATMDYLPPVGLKLFDVLRAVLVTDTMLFGRANQHYRFLLIDAFHRRGLIPSEPGSLASEALMLTPATGLEDLRMPCTGEALLHTITAAEYRRQFMVVPSRIENARRALEEQINQRDDDWSRRIEKFANDHRDRLRLNPRRLVRLAGLHGSTQRDSAGNLVARVAVTLVQDRGTKAPEGVTLICDSDGEIKYVVGGRTPASPRYQPPANVTATDKAFAKDLLKEAAEAGVLPPNESHPDGLWTPTEPSADRRSWRRPLRIIPFDPMIDRAGRSVIADVPYETIENGPTGRLVEVIDYDPVHECWYEPVDLDDPAVMLNSGLDVAESDPRFHQQMVYAVVMRVLETFERALGRPFRWRGNRRLRVYPHAFLGNNAYFDDQLFALLFGFFAASEDDPGANLPGQTVFTALSHDIIAHETTHAVLHRLRRHYAMPTNPDVLAFHEGFADIVAILQHFTYPEIVAERIAATRADLTDRTMTDATPLLDLASQFGYATGSAKPLRTALMEPNTMAYRNAIEEHDRGAVLVSAVVDGFLRSYQEAIADLIRIATAGSGVLQPGSLHPDLVARIAATASSTADRITQICIRAFDYLPPVDVTFSDYLRALVTSDIDLFPEDADHLRANLIEGFRVRGIYPVGVVSLADKSLRLPPADPTKFSPLPFVKERLLDAAREFDLRRRSREKMVSGAADETTERVEGGAEWAHRDLQQRWATDLHGWAVKHYQQLGLAEPIEGRDISVDGFFTSQRVDADGYLQSQIIAQFVQRDKEHDEDLGGITPLGGVTVIANGEGQIRYVIAKMLPTADEDCTRLEQLRGFAAAAESRLSAAKWSKDPTRRLIDKLTLRSLDARM